LQNIVIVDVLVVVVNVVAVNVVVTKNVNITVAEILILK
jgi:hypothetical protein